MVVVVMMVMVMVHGELGGGGGGGSGGSSGGGTSEGFISKQGKGVCSPDDAVNADTEQSLHIEGVEATQGISSGVLQSETPS